MVPVTVQVTTGAEGDAIKSLLQVDVQVWPCTASLQLFLLSHLVPLGALGKPMQPGGGGVGWG